MVLALLLACAREEGNRQGAAREPAPATPAPAPRPETKLLTLMLEGTPERIPARLFSSKAVGLSVPFTTYAPRDFSVSAGADAKGETVRFVADFGGVRNEEAFLEITFLPDHSDSAAAAQAFLLAISAAGTPRTIGKRQPWTIEEAGFTRESAGQTIVGWAGRSRHGTHWFHAIEAFPEEYAEGMGPRVGALFREWRWEDTGDSL